ncbi:MAG: hypothetical protein WD081_09265 [Gammaproteobacteria bacterium]
MKKPGFAVLMGAALIVAAGCSITPVEKRTPAYELDYERMALIEHVANKRGVRIIWVNAPTRTIL